MPDEPTQPQLPPISGGEPSSPPAASESLPQVEGYQISARLGEGGMGTVWRAEQLSTRREVALKLIGTAVLGSEQARIRFDREVELTARLDHPNIARVYDSGLHHGVYYYAMELIQGVHLDKYVEDHKLTQRQILELMRTVCQAIQHAHERGVIHRDLKPSNILVTGDGQPHVLDFGLAKSFLEADSDLNLTVTGQAAGTPAYMSPEQAAGRHPQLNTRSDVYSLGVILFQLLTRQLPHDLSGGRDVALRRISEEEVKRPREITKDVDRELEALLLKALFHDPEKRYGSAGGLAQDIDNYLNGEPLTAKLPGRSYFLRKRLRKHRLPLAIAGAFVAMMVLTVFGYLRAPVKLQEPRKETKLPGRLMPTGDMTVARESHTATLLKDGRVLIVGGNSGAVKHQISSAEIYNPQSQIFSVTGSMHLPRWGHSAVLLDDGRVLVLGGWVSSYINATDTAEIFDPITGRFTFTKGRMSTPKADSPSLVKLANGRVLVLGGTLEGMYGTATANVDSYDPASDSFTYEGNLALARRDNATCLLENGRVLLIGGFFNCCDSTENEQRITTAELYDPISKRSVLTSRAPNFRRARTAAALRLNGGRCLVVGGGPAAELYDPASDRFTVTGDLLLEWGYSPVITPLQDGRVLISGRALRVYDPTNESFVTVSTNFFRNCHTTTRLLDGRVLLTGGTTAEGPATRSAVFFIRNER